MSHESVNQPLIIDHVPSQEELVAAARVEAAHSFGDAMPFEQVDLILRAAGVSAPDRSTAQPGISPRQTQPIQRYEAPLPEPYVPQEHERPISAQELKRLREQVATHDSSNV